MKKLFFFATALLAFAACTRETIIDTPAGKMTLIATTESSADTRTVIEGETHVNWEPGDALAVFSEGKSGRFATNIKASSPTAEFYGTYSVFDGADLWAVYPYSNDAVFTGETIETVLPSEQVARAGSFGKDMNLAIAHSTTSSLQFYNVGGGIRFRVTHEGIKKIVFEGYGEEYLSGKLSVGIDEDGLPVVREVTEGCSFITLLPQEGQDSFLPNSWYYCVAIPGILEYGFKLTFYKENSYARRASGKEVEIKRGVYGSMDKVDEGLVFIPFPTTVTRPEDTNNIPDPIDLGLPSGIKWGSNNLGASRPSKLGDFYAWGETEPYYSVQGGVFSWNQGKESGYDWLSYQWCMGSELELTKYCTNPALGYNGFTDNKTILDPEDDAAIMTLGGKWRMPTMADWEELLTLCSMKYVLLPNGNGQAGLKVTGPNGSSIFLPGSGFVVSVYFYYDGWIGAYWSSSLCTESTNAWVFPFQPGEDLKNDAQRYIGCTIRPVYDPSL